MWDCLSQRPGEVNGTDRASMVLRCTAGWGRGRILSDDHRVIQMQTKAKTTVKPTAGDSVLVLSYWNLNTPYREALKFLTGQMLLELERDGGGSCRLLVCGGPVPAGAPHPGIVFVGRVPDIVPYVRRADICLAPIFTGSGTRLKILEYMAAGKPVVATPKGAEGLTGEVGVHFELAEPTAFVSAVRRLAGDPVRASRMGAEARRLASERRFSASFSLRLPGIP